MAEDSTDPGAGDGRVPDLYDVGSGGVHRLECRFSMADRDDRRQEYKHKHWVLNHTVQNLAYKLRKSSKYFVSGECFSYKKTRTIFYNTSKEVAQSLQLPCEEAFKYALHSRMPWSSFADMSEF